MKDSWLHYFLIAVASGGFGGALGYLTHEDAAQRDCEIFRGVLLKKQVYDCHRRDMVQIQEELDSEAKPEPAAKPESTE